jgi:uncharacterized membrane protein YgaE (UPF0421/DUF939 family)
MDLEKLISVVEDVENKSNKDLFDAQNILIEEFDKTKQLILDLTKHLESVETLYDKVNNEIGKRIKKI